MSRAKSELNVASKSRRIALVLHVEPKTRTSAERALRDGEARLEEAVGLTAAIGLDIAWAGTAPLARPGPPLC